MGALPHTSVPCRTARSEPGPPSTNWPGGRSCQRALHIGTELPLRASRHGASRIRSVQALSLSSSVSVALRDLERAVKGLEPHASIGVAQDLHALLRVDVNVAHRRRPQLAADIAGLDVGGRNWRSFSTKVTLHAPITTSDLHLLLDDVPNDHSKEALGADIAQLANEFAKLTGSCCVSVKLEYVTNTLCPRLHTDKVPARLLVTYAGAGTLYAANAAVDRSRLVVPPEARGNDGALRPGSSLCQTAACDVLLLKGDTWPGNEGCGAIHRSPHDTSSESPRLVLTIDCA